MKNQFIANHRELLVYRTAFEAAMQVFEQAQSFPEHERTLLTHPLITSSRLVCTNLSAAWQKRRYKGAFVATLNIVEVKAAETQTWLEFAILCDYLNAETGQELFHQYTRVLSDVSRFVNHADAWVMTS